jgi:hypothetical protein
MSQPLCHWEHCYSAYIHLICQGSREAVLQMYLSVRKPLDIVLLVICHNYITECLLAVHYTTYFKVPFIHK